MEKIQNILLVILILCLIAAMGVFLLPRLNKERTYLSVSTSHPAEVFIDGKSIGKSPLLARVNKKDIKVRMEVVDSELGVFEEQIVVAKDTTTRLQVIFSDDPLKSSYVVSYFEKINPSEVEISVVSLPNLARLKVDDQIRGFTPVKLVETLGKHNIQISFEGYVAQQFEVETREGYRSISIVKLAKDLAYVPIETVQTDMSTEIKEEEDISASKDQVEILETPTGFLRVRKEPNSSSEEVGQVLPSEKYELIETDNSTGWFRIYFNEGEVGWISSQYAKVVKSD